jgi:hypothetical protein
MLTSYDLREQRPARDLLRSAARRRDVLFVDADPVLTGYGH